MANLYLIRTITYPLIPSRLTSSPPTSCHSIFIPFSLPSRLPPISLQIPVSVANKRQIVARFSEGENITTTVQGFVDYFEVEEVRAAAQIELERSFFA